MNNRQYEYLQCALQALRLEELGHEEQYKVKIYDLYRLSQSMNVKFLYRYRPDDWERDKELFENNEIWLSPMSKQNDPFEFSLSSKVYDINVENFILQAFMDYKNKLSIACFSESNDNILMWAHYANNHKGYCIEYSMRDILEKCQCYVLPVLYQKTKPLIEEALASSSLSSYLLVFKIITTKSLCWEYEREWRFIKNIGVHGGKDLFPGPTAVYLGCKTERILEDELYAACERKNISLFKMQEDRDEYKVNLEKIL